MLTRTPLFGAILTALALVASVTSPAQAAIDTPFTSQTSVSADDPTGDFQGYTKKRPAYLKGLDLVHFEGSYDYLNETLTLTVQTAESFPSNLKRINGSISVEVAVYGSWFALWYTGAPELRIASYHDGQFYGGRNGLPDGCDVAYTAGSSSLTFEITKACFPDDNFELRATGGAIVTEQRRHQKPRYTWVSDKVEPEGTIYMGPLVSVS